MIYLLPLLAANIQHENEPAKLSDLEIVFGNVLNASVGAAAIILFIMIVVGGFNYLTAGGDPQKAGSAKNTLTYAVYGMIFVSLAYLVLRLIAFFTGVDSILDFKINQ